MLPGADAKSCLAPRRNRRDSTVTFCTRSTDEPSTRRSRGLARRRPALMNLMLQEQVETCSAGDGGHALDADALTGHAHAVAWSTPGNPRPVSKTFGEAVADDDGVPHRRGRAVRHGASGDWLASSPLPGVAAAGARKQRQVDMGIHRDLEPRAVPRRRRATTRSAAASTTPSPSPWPRRPSPTCCGWRPRPPISSRRQRMLRRGDPRRVPRTRCWPTTCRRRSTGTPPA